MPVMAAALLAVIGLLGQAGPGPKELKHVAPEFPEDARRAGLAQDVLLGCQIDPQGVVSHVEVLKGVPPLTDAAIAAVKQWRYEPTLQGGVPVPVTIAVTVRFQLEALRFDDLMSSLESPNEYLRAAAATNLGGTLTGSPVPGIGLQAGRFDVEAAVPALERMVRNDESNGARAAAARSLNQLDGRPLPPGVSQAEPAVELAEPVTAPASVPLDQLSTPPKVRKMTRPQYPRQAFTRKIEGTVLVEILIDTQGRVAKSRVIQSVPGLDEAALACVKDWRFDPAMKEGRPVATLAHVPVNFRIK